MKSFFSFVLIFISTYCFAQDNYWQQQVDFKIDVTLDDKAHSLTGSIEFTYLNNSPDTLHYIWIHLWPNAYKNDRTAYTKQQIENGNTDFYFSKEENRGYINRLNFIMNEEVCETEDHPQHQDITRLLLPTPLLPNASANFSSPFHVKLPYNFSRGGHIGNSYQVTQWYPKPAVYDKDGWHPMPYLDQGEFYSEFGSYNVTIHAPADYMIASTGILKSESITDSIRSITFVQDNIHDFAWFADKNFEVITDTLQLPSKIINVYAYYNRANSKSWGRSLEYIKRSVLTKSLWLGEYPYDAVSIVERPKGNGGGMEYPMITLISSPDESLINHEVGHNWFYGILATNERSYPWMDEGMNSYYDKRYDSLYSPTTVNRSKNFLSKRIPDDAEGMALKAMESLKKDQPINTSSEDFSFFNYSLIAYEKAARWMQLLEQKMGTTAFDLLMKNYYELWKFRHPYPEDFKKLAMSHTDADLNPLFQLLDKKGSLEKREENKKLKIMGFFSLKNIDKYNHLFIAPAIGYNTYDKFMAGIVLHNYTLPLPALKFIAVPLYATGSRDINGIGNVTWTKRGLSGNQFEFIMGAAKYNIDQFTDSTGKKNHLSFYKLVPGLRYVFASNPRSSSRKYLQFKTFFINETTLLFRRDTTIQQNIITYPKSSRYINQFQAGIENNRKLYPYSAIFQVEQGDGFLKSQITGNYFFNYATGGGLQVRIFAGKFFYTGSQSSLSSFETARYHFNMTGPNGYEDYTYSNYFLGRNEFEGTGSQQIMIRDGAFKVRTDLLSNKVGRSDDWLGAINFTTDIPKKVNPLSVLPFSVPVKLFADIGTYSEAWEKNSGNSRFLYDAGFQLSVLKVLHIYFPVLHSKIYTDYYKSTITERRFVKKISFSIDIQNLALRKFSVQSPL